MFEDPRSVLRRMVRGCCYLPGYGHHPGTSVLVALVCLAAVSGAEQGLATIAARALAALLALSGPYLFGAYNRGRDAEFHPWWQREQQRQQARRARREAAARPRRLP